MAGAGPSSGVHSASVAGAADARATDSAAVPAAQRAGAPLASVRVLAVEQYGAGPWGTLYLADLGAEVIKIENLREGGDVGRRVGPYFSGPDDSDFHQTFNRNKRSIGLDLKHPEARAVFEDLARSADAVLDNLRGDLAGKLRLDYASLSPVNAKLVCAHLSAYGRDSSRASWPGYDYLMQAEAGWMSLTGEPGGPPARFGLSLVDLITGLTTAFALLAGVIRARATGIGGDFDVSLFDTALHNVNYPATWFLNRGVVTERHPRGAHPSLTPSQLYRTADGWLSVMCNKEKFWPILCGELGRPEWATDPRYATFAARLEHRDALTVLLDDAFGRRSTHDWLQRLAGRVPVAPVLNVGEALDNSFAAERGAIADYAYPDGRMSKMVVSPVRVADTRLPRNAAPALGADSESVLGALGYSTEHLAALRGAGVLR
jgi:succinate---hydroxymethylglutarate CoA-transferase